MSMKHEYEVGQGVWWNDLKCEITQIINGRIVLNDHVDVDDSVISPYPPVKAVDGWAVVNRSSEIITIGITKPESNWMAANGYRCVKGQFIPNSDNS